MMEHIDPLFALTTSAVLFVVWFVQGRHARIARRRNNH